MKTSRSSHGMCYLQGYIYLIGGATHNQGILNSCERFNTRTNFVEEIAPLNNGATSCCVCTFNDKFIFKFGGIGNSKQLNNFIEKYDVSLNSWGIVDPQISMNENPTSFALLSTSCCIQINSNDIFIFGGYNLNNEGNKLSYILTCN